jgi:acetyltransferase-like isoleucine patch superfamily enzyme
VFIGANSTVLKDITEPGIYIGSPCRLLRHHPA